VPQPRRHEEINRFKQDPACRLFLSTDSGSVGLNLQAARRRKAIASTRLVDSSRQSAVSWTLPCGSPP